MFPSVRNKPLLSVVELNFSMIANMSLGESKSQDNGIKQLLQFKIKNLNGKLYRA